MQRMAYLVWYTLLCAISLLPEVVTSHVYVLTLAFFFRPHSLFARHYRSLGVNWECTNVGRCVRGHVVRKQLTWLTCNARRCKYTQFSFFPVLARPSWADKCHLIFIVLNVIERVALMAFCELTIADFNCVAAPHIYCVRRNDISFNNELTQWALDTRHHWVRKLCLSWKH